jgi:hypothetical protein
MKIDRIRDSLSLRPFRPIVLSTTDGRVFRIDRPEFASISRSGRKVVIATEDDSHATLDESEIEGVRVIYEIAPDGLSDDQGPIPAFGPAQLDPSGRLVMSDEEREARRLATIRALKVIPKITDETDTDEMWDEIARALREGH